MMYLLFCMLLLEINYYYTIIQSVHGRVLA